MKFQDKYRIESTRLPNWDYASPDYYFVTICCHDHLSRFGNIIDDEICLNPIGIIARNHWLEIPVHFLFVELDAFVIMPNHLHGIVVITDGLGGDSESTNRNQPNPGRDAASTNRDQPIPGRDAASTNRNHPIPCKDVASTDRNQPKPGRDAACCVSTPNQKFSSRATDRIGPGSLGAIIRSYKSAVTKQAHESGFDQFRWQSRYYDHLIETETALKSIRDYIEANQANWQNDEENC